MAQDSGVQANGKVISRSTRNRKGGGSFANFESSKTPRKGFTAGPGYGKVPFKAPTAPAPTTMKGGTGKLVSKTISSAPPTMGPVSRSPIGGTDFGGGGGDTMMSTMSAEAPAISDEDYLAGESGYQAQLAALMRALSDYTADDTAQRTKYAGDYSEATKNLGWRDPDGDGPGAGNWDLEDLNTASGRGYQNQINDFASRGMLQSSLYGEANDNFMRSMNDQLGSMGQAKTDFLSDRDRQLNSFKGENTLSQQQARAEAIARRAAGLTI